MLNVHTHTYTHKYTHTHTYTRCVNWASVWIPTRLFSFVVIYFPSCVVSISLDNLCVVPSLLSRKLCNVRKRWIRKRNPLPISAHCTSDGNTTIRKEGDNQIFCIQRNKYSHVVVLGAYITGCSTLDMMCFYCKYYTVSVIFLDVECLPV